VDLFSGAGGTSIGFSRPIEQGHDPGAITTPTMRIALAVELDRWAHKTYAINHPEIPLNRLLRVDLTRHTTAKKIRMALSGEPNLVLIIGGPPCQKVSLIGTTGRRLATSKYGRFDRRRGAETYRAFRDVVRTLRTRFFILENVPGLFAAHDGTACHDIIEDFSDLYSTASIHVEAHDHGVPQRRRRILIAGVLKRGSPEIAHNALTFLLDRLLTPSCTLPGLQRLVKQFPTCHRSIHPAGQSSAGILCQLMLRRPLAGSVLPIN
jgi:DNA (cytosine-5)-methyltransferase 1